MADAVDDANEIAGLCGDRDYAIYERVWGASPLTWITVTKDDPTLGTHTITAMPDDISLVTNSLLTLQLKTTYADYPGNVNWTPFTVCYDCSLLSPLEEAKILFEERYSFILVSAG